MKLNYLVERSPFVFERGADKGRVSESSISNPLFRRSSSSEETPVPLYLCLQCSYIVDGGHVKAIDKMKRPLRGTLNGAFTKCLLIRVVFS